ncbi:hypothetical protein BC937DRAFT_89093 [Endogone sp. FLAS-F59071]|nr:hypothetical protein BC937DRAFT_89093 [Endogone sp. FLAS-F59071]|eukprot:RUS18154.1 hypothetical protein BC937DRAFT_89093 [Endogone sp. FLAS-F59071]
MATTSKVRKHKGISFNPFSPLPKPAPINSTLSPSFSPFRNSDVLHPQATREPRRRTYPVARALFAKEQPPLRLKRVVQEDGRSRMPLQPVPIELVPTPPSESEQLVVALAGPILELWTKCVFLHQLIPKVRAVVSSISFIADTLKKRGSEVTRVVDGQCQTTVSDVAERLQGFVDETEQKFDEAISHYKCHTSGLDEEQFAALKRLRTGFDKYQMVTSTLLESLEKIEVQLGRARKEFDKEMGQTQTTHRTQRAQLKSQIDKLCADYRRRVGSTIKVCSSFIYRRLFITLAHGLAHLIVGNRASKRLQGRYARAV